MNYIWEVLLRAKELSIHENSIYFFSAVNPSPYIEVAQNDLNPISFENNIPVNPFYRFSNIFHPFLEQGFVDSPEIEKVLFDIIMHFLANLDLYEGLSHKEYYRFFLKEDIEKNAYGKEYKDILAVFSFKDRHILLENAVKLYTLGPSIELLSSLLTDLFSSSLIYFDHVDINTLLVYIGKKQTTTLTKQVHFIVDLFVPIDFIIEIFWDVHFGVINIDETMLIDDFAIY